MQKFLIDENLSPLLAKWLRGLGYDARSVREVALKGKSDEEILRWLRERGSILITSDLDFGEFFYWRNFGDFGVIILRGERRSVVVFEEMLSRLHKQGILKDERLVNSLLVVNEKGYRWRRFHQ